MMKDPSTKNTNYTSNKDINHSRIENSVCLVWFKKFIMFYIVYILCPTTCPVLVHLMDYLLDELIAFFSINRF